MIDCGADLYSDTYQAESIGSPCPWCFVDLPPVFPWPEGVETLTVRWPADSKFPTVASAWYREDDGRIVATYTREQMQECVTVAYAWGMLPAGIAWSTSGAAG